MEPDHDDAFCALPLDTRGEHQVGRFRLFAAACCLLGAAWLVVISPPSKGYYCAGLGFLACLMWVAMWARGRRIVQRATEHGLVLAAEGLTHSTPDKTTRLSWERIESIEADEDRLVVEVTQKDGEPLSLIPRYGGLGMYELEAAIRAACRRGCASAPASLQLASLDPSPSPEAPPEAQTPPNEASR